MTPISLRTRVLLALCTSVVIGMLALAIGGRHLERLFASHGSMADAAFHRAVWTTLAVVFFVANGAAALAVWLTARTLTKRIVRLRAVVQARDTLDSAVERVRMESDRNRAIVDTVFASVFAVDGGGRILSANPAAARMFDQPLSTLIGAILTDLLAIDSLHLSVDDLGTVSFTGTDEARRFSTRIRLYGRNAFAAEVAVTPLALDGQRAWAVFIHDLTEKQQTDAALEDARRAVEVANRSRSAFLARMSHELRSPLNAMIGFTRIVRRSRSSELSERDRHHLDRVQTSSEQLLDFVSDILDLSQIESGRMELQLTQVDVVPIVRELVTEFEPQVADRPLLIEADVPNLPAIATIDAGRLRQVLVNLVSNASRFTARGSIVISVSLHPDTGLASAITVRDSGIGIPLDRQSHIFESFEAGDEEDDHRYGGSGLGLALSWRIAQQMGCMLSVESSPGAGSAFTLAFQSNPVAAPASVHAPLPIGS